VSTAASTNVCQVNMGAAPSVPYPDGNNGIDNSWGKNVLPLLLNLDTAWVTNVNGALQAGQFNTLFEMHCLPATGDATGFTTKLFRATPLGSTPKLDGTDTWPVAPELLTNPTDPESSAISSGNCSVTGTTFDTGKNQTLPLTFPFGNVAMNLILQAAQVTMTLSADRKSATGGMVGGVINTQALVNEVKKVGYARTLCGNSVLTTIITMVEQSSDILSDGTQDPSKTCDGISIGLGFDAIDAVRGNVGPPAPPLMACP
jgi:hypothetical protein